MRLRKWIQMDLRTISRRALAAERGNSLFFSFNNNERIIGRAGNKSLDVEVKRRDSAPLFDRFSTSSRLAGEGNQDYPTCFGKHDHF